MTPTLFPDAPREIFAFWTVGGLVQFEFDGEVLELTGSSCQQRRSLQPKQPTPVRPVKVAWLFWVVRSGGERVDEKVWPRPSSLASGSLGWGRCNRMMWPFSKVTRRPFVPRFINVMGDAIRRSANSDRRGVPESSCSHKVGTCGGELLGPSC